MSDVKDILGMSRPAAPISFDAEPSKAKAPKTKRPEGMSREAFALLGDSAPIVPTHMAEGPQAHGLKQKRKPSTKGQVGPPLRAATLQPEGNELPALDWQACVVQA